MSQSFAGIILAAGKGTRMKSDLPKVLHEVCGLPMVEHVGRGLRSAGVSKPIVVVGFGGDQVMARLGDSYDFAWQHEQHGTGHAVQQALPALGDHNGPVIIACGDTPLIGVEVFQELIEAHLASGALATIASSIMPDPTGYGRIVRGADGFVTGIVEHKDATPEQRAIGEINSGLYCFDGKSLRDLLPQLNNDNSQGEYYLTDMVGLIVGSGGRVAAHIFADPGVTVGVNDRWQLAEAGKDLQRRILKRHAQAGVTLRDIDTIFISPDVTIAPDAVIEPCTVLIGATSIGARSVIGPNTRIESSVIGARSKVLMSQVVKAAVGDDVSIGPFANLRPKADVRDHAKVGNFVELKNSVLEEGAKVSHLSYIGDAHVGAETNIGAGVITCNYDGYDKSRTEIGANAFVGSNSTLVAPVTISDGALIAAGSVITKSVEPDAAAFGRARQENKEGWAAEFRKRKTKDR